MLLHLKTGDGDLPFSEFISCRFLSELQEKKLCRNYGFFCVCMAETGFYRKYVLILILSGHRNYGFSKIDMILDSQILIGLHVRLKASFSHPIEGKVCSFYTTSDIK